MELNLSEEYKSYPFQRRFYLNYPLSDDGSENRSGNRLVHAESLIKVVRLKLFLIL